MQFALLIGSGFFLGVIAMFAMMATADWYDDCYPRKADPTAWD